MREAAKKGHRNYLVAGIQSGEMPSPDGVSGNNTSFVRFNGPDIPFQIVGMSDVMPYDSRRFLDLTDSDIAAYEASFGKKLKEAVNRFKPDIIHSHHLWILTSLARRSCPWLPVVTSCHGSDLRQFKNCRHLREIVLSGCKDIDRVMALSPIQREEIADLYGLPLERIAVTGAGYNNQLFYHAPKPRPEPVELVYAGKLSNAKGVPWFLRAVAAIGHPDWRLHLVGGGSGPEKDLCLKLAHKLGKRIIVHGTVSQQDLALLMRRSHLFVLPSFYEGLPLVVLEALACGCRVVATRLPGLTEIVNRVGTHFIKEVAIPRLHGVDMPWAEDESDFEQNLTFALKDQMRSVIRDPNPEFGVIKSKIARYSWAGVFDGVEDVYFETAGSCNRA